jgi:uncharacterized membrane protein
VAETIGAIVMLVSLLVLVLPVLTFLRLNRLAGDLTELAARVRSLEDAMRQPAAAPRPSVAAPAPPPATVVESIPDAAPPPIDHVPIPEPVAAAVADTRETLDLERRIGGRWLLYAGLLILLIGISFFLKYAFDNEWVNAPARVAIGVATGLALIAGGRRLARRDLRAFGSALMGAGVAVLYLSIYAALEFYGLIDRVTAFGSMALVTGGAVAVADRERAQVLAVIGIGGGFLTPFLVGGEGNAQLTLFSYDAVLVAASLVLLHRHGWASLAAVAYVLTSVTVFIWYAVHYRDPMWLRTFLFLTLFGGFFVAMLRKLRTIGGGPAMMVSALLWTAPPIYHLSALALTAPHPPALHLYLIVFSVAGVMLTTEPHRPWIRVLVLLAAMVPLFGDLALPRGASWLLANIVTIVVVSGVHLFGSLDRVLRQREPLTTPDLAAMHLAGLGLYGLLYQTSEARFPELRGVLAIGVAAIAAGLWTILRRRDAVAALNAAALGLTLLAVAVAVQFDGRTVVVGWAAEGALITWIGVRARNNLFRAGGLLLWLAAIWRLADGYFDTPVGFTAIVNERSLATLFVLVVGYLLAWGIARQAAAESASIRVALHVALSMLALFWISAEIKSYWNVRYETPQAYLYEELMLSLGWGLYGAAAVVAGLWRGYPPLRYIGITVIAVTVLKVFFVDLWGLGGIYRVIGFIALGVLLVLVSYLYQRSRREPTSPVEG